MKVEKPRKSKEKQQSAQELRDHEGEQKSCASDAQTDSGSSCSSHGYRKVSHEDIELAQSLIERCLQLYMTRDEVVAILVNRAKLEPGFIRLVWQKLEEENAEFFKAYYARLKLKKQIIIFNLLLERQHHLMNLREPQNVMPPFMHNGLQHMSVTSQMAYIPPQLPYVPSNDCTHMESSRHDGFSYIVANGIPALGSYYPVQMTAADMGTLAGIKQEMAKSCSAESHDQFLFAPEESVLKIVDSMTFDAPFSSNMCRTGGLQLPPDGNVGIFLDNTNSHFRADLAKFEDLGVLENHPSSLFSLSDIDTLLNSPGKCDIVDHFLVDDDPNS